MTGKEGVMRSIFARRILFSAFVLGTSPLFGGGGPVREFRYSRISFQQPIVRAHCLGSRSGGYVMAVTHGKATQAFVGPRRSLGFSAFGK
jgi:hypothetical protein